jgi:hypothetical protein
MKSHGPTAVKTPPASFPRFQESPGNAFPASRKPIMSGPGALVKVPAGKGAPASRLSVGSSAGGKVFQGERKAGEGPCLGLGPKQGLALRGRAGPEAANQRGRQSGWMAVAWGGVCVTRLRFAPVISMI